MRRRRAVEPAPTAADAPVGQAGGVRIPGTTSERTVRARRPGGRVARRPGGRRAGVVATAVATAALAVAGCGSPTGSSAGGTTTTSLAMVTVTVHVPGDPQTSAELVSMRLSDAGVNGTAAPGTDPGTIDVTGAASKELLDRLAVPGRFTFRPVLSQMTPTSSSLPADVCQTGVPAAQRDPTGTAVLPQCEGTTTLTAAYQVGPVALANDAIAKSSAVLNPNGQWTVNPVFKSGAVGIDGFNAVAARCFAKDATCPTGQLVMVLDGRVISAPIIQNPSFQADQIQISGQWTQTSAEALAAVLSTGPLPGA